MGLWSAATASCVVALLASLCTGQYQQNQSQPQQYQQQPQQYKNSTAPYGNFTSRAGAYGNYSSGPQYPPAYGAGGQYGNATGGATAAYYQQQGDPFAWQWDHEHTRRKSYNQEAQNWVISNMQQAWDFAVNLVGSKNAQYNSNGQCGKLIFSRREYYLKFCFRKVINFILSAGVINEKFIYVTSTIYGT